MFLKDATNAKIPVIVITAMMAMFAQNADLDVYLLCRTKNRDGKMKLRGTKPIEPTMPITSATNSKLFRNMLMFPIVCSAVFLAVNANGCLPANMMIDCRGNQQYGGKFSAHYYGHRHLVTDYNKQIVHMI